MFSLTPFRNVPDTMLAIIIFFHLLNLECWASGAEVWNVGVWAAKCYLHSLPCNSNSALSKPFRQQVSSLLPASRPLSWKKTKYAAFWPVFFLWKYKTLKFKIFFINRTVPSKIDLKSRIQEEKNLLSLCYCADLLALTLDFPAVALYPATLICSHLQHVLACTPRKNLVWSILGYLNPELVRLRKISAPAEEAPLLGTSHHGEMGKHPQCCTHVMP